jgi:outer membrane protein OmpA-like peptidoglycan-associated protein
LYIDNNSADVRLADGTKVVFVTPIRGKGIATVRIDGCAGSATITLEFDSSPRFSAYTPDFGSTEGGTRVSITGIQLDGASVKVGGVDGKIVSNSSTSLIFTTPTGLPGVSSIVVTTASGTLTLPFTYIAPPDFLSFTTPYLQQGAAGTVFFATKNTDTIELLSGRIPAGMNFVSPLGTVSGTPTAHGTYTFTLLVKNKIGEKTSTFNLVVDKPIPDDMVLDLPMKFNDAKEADAFQKRFKDFLEIAKSSSPAKFIPFVFLEGGSQITSRYADVDGLGKLRHTYIMSMISSAPLATSGSVSNYCSSNTGRVRLTLSWKKSAADFTACTNKASVKPTEPTTPEKPTPPAIEESILDVKVRVYFSMGSVNIAPAERKKLNDLAARVKSSSASVISISGFAQPTRGTELSDPALSKKRAMAVSDFLKGLGVEGIENVDGKGRAKLNIAASRYVEVTVKPAP